MILALKLAYRNLIGAGLRTWLNVIVLAFAFIIIVLYHGLNKGWNLQAKRDTIAWQVGKGELRNNNYDPYDPFTIADGHGHLDNTAALHLEPVLVRQGAIYPEGRLISAVINGIDAKQEILKLPTKSIVESNAEIPAVIGKRMAASSKLNVGDEVLMRWRDVHGTYDAASITIVDIFDCNVPAIDNGQIWLDINQLWQLTEMPQNEASYYISTIDRESLAVTGWTYQNQAELLEFIDKLAEMDKIGAAIMYLLLLAIALLAIFDTQVLAIFRRQKEIGTYIALGLTRGKVVALFTAEGTMYSILATIVGMIAGYPIFKYFEKNGINMGSSTDDYGVAMAEKLVPVYGVDLILSTTALLIVSATIVSFLPAKKIARMNPVDALKGKMQ